MIVYYSIGPTIVNILWGYNKSNGQNGHAHTHTDTYTHKSRYVKTVEISKYIGVGFSSIVKAVVFL